MLLPDAAVLVGNDELAWRVSLTLSQVAHALLCTAAAWWLWPTRARVPLTVAAVWFLGQAYDEWANGNLWPDGLWEYAVLLALAPFTFYHMLRTP